MLASAREFAASASASDVCDMHPAYTARYYRNSGGGDVPQVFGAQGFRNTHIRFLPGSHYSSYAYLLQTSLTWRVTFYRIVAAGREGELSSLRITHRRSYLHRRRNELHCASHIQSTRYANFHPGTDPPALPRATDARQEILTRNGSQSRSDKSSILCWRP